MKKALFLSALLLTASAFGVREKSPFLKGITYPEKTVKVARKDVKSSSVGQESFQNCYVYPKIVVVELDSGQIGADSLLIRNRTNPSLRKICSSEPWRDEVKLPSSDQYFLGKAGDYLFNISADGFGEAGGMWVYDAGNGKLLDEIYYHLHQEFTVIPQTDGISLEFYEQLKLDCSLAPQFDDCWAKTREANNIPASVKLKTPDCAEIYKGKDFKDHPELINNPGAIQIFTKVRVDDIRSAKRTFINGSVLCNASP